MGEAKVDLGYAYYLAGRRHEGDHLLTEGLSDLEPHGPPEFLARAKRKVAHAYMRSWAFRKALHELVQVKGLVDTYDLSTLARKFGHVFVRRPVGGPGRALVGVAWPSPGE